MGEKSGKCENCGKLNAKMEKKNVMGKHGYFCNDKCYAEYKKKGEKKGVCEFC